MNWQRLLDERIGGRGKRSRWLRGPKRGGSDRSNDDVFLEVRSRLTGGAPAPIEVAGEMPNDDYRAPLYAGLVAIGLFFGVLGLWSVFAQIESGIIASGIIKSEGNRKVVQHPDGGVVTAILVKEGELVKKGQVLVKLDPTQVKAQLDIFTSNVDSLRAQEARARAERDHALSVEFPQDLMDRVNDSQVNDVLANQIAIFESRRSALEGQKTILQQQIAQVRSQAEGMRAQAGALNRQGQLISSQLEGARKLQSEGYTSKNRVMELERAMAAIGGQRTDYSSNVQRLEFMVSQFEAQIAQIERDRQAQVSAEYMDIQSKLSDALERQHAVQDVLDRTEIKAPETGHVIGLAISTVGGVIGRGDKILEIVPSNAPQIVEAQFSPMDAEFVKPGMTTEVRLVAYRSTTMPPLKGRVITRSADRLVDPRSGQGYYSGTVQVDGADLAKLQDVVLSPGMPVEVVVPTGSRSALTYLLEPLLPSLRHGLREQ